MNYKIYNLPAPVGHSLQIMRRTAQSLQMVRLARYLLRYRGKRASCPFGTNKLRLESTCVETYLMMSNK